MKEMAPMRYRLASRGGFPGPVGVTPGANLLVPLDLVGVTPRLQKFRSQCDRRDQQTDDSTNRVGRQDVRQRRRTTRLESSSWALPRTHDAEMRSTREQGARDSARKTKERLPTRRTGTGTAQSSRRAPAAGKDERTCRATDSEGLTRRSDAHRPSTARVARRAGQQMAPGQRR